MILVRRQRFWDRRHPNLRESLAHFGLILRCVSFVKQASVLDGFAFDPFSFQQDGLTAPEVDIGRRQIVDALVVAQVIVVGDEGFDPNLKLAGQIVVSNRMRFLSVRCQRSIFPCVIG